MSFRLAGLLKVVRLAAVALQAVVLQAVVLLKLQVLRLVDISRRPRWLSVLCVFRLNE